MERLFSYILGITVTAAFAVVLLCSPPSHSSSYGQPLVAKKIGEFDHIEAQSITLKSPDGKSNITIQANDDLQGFWITNKDHPGSIAVYADKDQGLVIGMYRDTKKAKALDIAVSVAKDRSTTIQIVAPNGRIQTFSADALRRSLQRRL